MELRGDHPTMKLRHKIIEAKYQREMKPCTAMIDGLI